MRSYFNLFHLYVFWIYLKRIYSIYSIDSIFCFPVNRPRTGQNLGKDPLRTAEVFGSLRKPDARRVIKSLEPVT